MACMVFQVEDGDVDGWVDLGKYGDLDGDEVEGGTA